jgi:UDP-3-O-[3-hydroxymyristoyl] glucosamine N-acyltransferase
VAVTVRELAEWVRGEALGDAELPISNARSLADAQPGDITIVEDDEHLGAWHASKASAAVVPGTIPVNGRPLIRVPEPRTAFARILDRLRGHPLSDTHTIDPTARVHPSARLGPGVSVGPFAVVGEETDVGPNTTLRAGAIVGRFCAIGADVTIHSGAVLYDDCRVGDRIIIHANAVVGADGFGYRSRGGRHVKVPQLGWVEIEDDVEVGASTTIDRGTFGPTRVGVGTKTGDLVMVAHNCQIGRHNVLTGQVGIAGSSTTGDHVVMAGQAGVIDHVRVGDRAVVGAQAAVMRNVPADTRVLGCPARPEGSVAQVYAVLEGLPEICEDIRRLKGAVGLGDAEKPAAVGSERPGS